MLRLILSTLLILGEVLFTTYAYAEEAKVVKAENVILTTKNTVIFRGTVTESSVSDVQMRLAKLVKKRGINQYTIYLVMDSPGGSIIDGEDFISMARTFPNVDTISIFAASMASAIVQALPGKRFITANGIQMYHRAAGGFRGQFEDGEVESMLAFVKNIVRSMEQRSANRIGMSLAQYKAKAKDEWWLYGAQNVLEKTADGVVQIICTPELIDSREIQESFSFFGGARKEIYSGCPLLRSPIKITEE